MEKDKQYWYHKLDEIYGLVYSTKLIIEMMRREKPEITKKDVDDVINNFNFNVEDILKEDE